MAGVELRGMRKCPACGRKVHGRALQCGGCGEWLPGETMVPLKPWSNTRYVVLFASLFALYIGGVRFLAWAKYDLDWAIQEGFRGALFGFMGWAVVLAIVVPLTRWLYRKWRRWRA